jgi:hypothetical protein
LSESKQENIMPRISETIIPFTNDFGYVMIVGACIAIEVVAFARIFGGVPRKVYSQDFMSKNFGQLHVDTFGEEIGTGGFPDTGSGYYSQKLAYKDWFEFNNSQRVHLHFVEWVATYLFLLVCAGVYYPITSASIGLAIFVDRIFYALGYVIQGPKGRVIPFIINIILTSILGFIAILSGIQHIVR